MIENNSPDSSGACPIAYVRQCGQFPYVALATAPPREPSRPASPHSTEKNSFWGLCTILGWRERVLNIPGRNVHDQLSELAGVTRSLGARRVAILRVCPAGPTGRNPLNVAAKFKLRHYPCLRRSISYESRRKSCILSLKAIWAAATSNMVRAPFTLRFGVIGSRHFVLEL